MKLFIKNMVCSRCIMVVKSELEKLGYHAENVILGEAEINKELSENEMQTIRETLSASGFELIDDNREINRKNQNHNSSVCTL